ncbi:hypothetical protein BKA93DRAFT_3569 [Sparassis latifolia]
MMLVVLGLLAACSARYLSGMCTYKVSSHTLACSILANLFKTHHLTLCSPSYIAANIWLTSEEKEDRINANITHSQQLFEAQVSFLLAQEEHLLQTFVVRTYATPANWYVCPYMTRFAPARCHVIRAHMVRAWGVCSVRGISRAFCFTEIAITDEAICAMASLPALRTLEFKMCYCIPSFLQPGLLEPGSVPLSTQSQPRRSGLPTPCIASTRWSCFHSFLTCAHLS